MVRKTGLMMAKKKIGAVHDHGGAIYKLVMQKVDASDGLPSKIGSKTTWDDDNDVPISE